jgi:hypothetical protein
MITFFPGMRPETRVKKEVILLTDGQYGCDSESEVVAASDALKQVADVYGMMIGISSRVSGLIPGKNMIIKVARGLLVKYSLVSF